MVYIDLHKIIFYKDKKKDFKKIRLKKEKKRDQK